MAKMQRVRVIIEVEMDASEAMVKKALRPARQAEALDDLIRLTKEDIPRGVKLVRVGLSAKRVRR